MASLIIKSVNTVEGLMGIAAEACRENLPSPVVAFGGKIYEILSFRPRKAEESRASYYVRETVASVAKAYFLVAAATFTLAALSASGSFLASSITIGAVFFAARSDAVANLFKPKAKPQVDLL